jgi:hypothetical protein
MRSPHQTRRSGGGPTTSSRYETTNSRVPADSSGEDDSYDFRADLKLSNRQKAPRQEEQLSSPSKPQQPAVVRQQQKKKASKAPRRKFGRPKEKVYKSGTELLEALGAVADDDAKAAADALGRDLELMGYDLDCETFITKGSSEASEEEDRYASRGPPDASQKSRSPSFDRDNRYAMEEEENEEEEEDEKNSEEDIEEVYEEEEEEGFEEEDREEASVDARDALDSTRDEIASGLVNDNTMGSYQSVASSKSSSESEEKPSKTNRSRKVVGDQKSSKLMSGAKGLSKVKAGTPSRGNKKVDKKKLPRKPAKSTSNPKALPLAAESPEKESKNIVIEGMSIFNEDGGVSVAPSNPPVEDFWENEATKEGNGNFAHHDAEERSSHPVQKKKRFWLPFRRAASTRKKNVFQSDKEELQNVEVGNEELKTQHAPALIPAPVLIPAPGAPDTNPDSSPGATSGSAINFFEPSVIVNATGKKNRSWLPLWNVGGETRQDTSPRSQPEQSSPVPTPQSKKNSGSHASQGKVRPQLTESKLQGDPARQQSLPRSPVRRNKVLLLSAVPEQGDSKPKISLPTAALIDLAESGVSSESGESIEISEGGGIKSGHDDAPPKKLIRVAVDPDKKKNSLFSRFRRNKKAAIEAGTRRMDVIQENENEEGFDVEFIISTGTVGTLYERVVPRSWIPNLAESVEAVRTPVPAPTPVPAAEAPVPAAASPVPAPITRSPVARSPVARSPVARSPVARSPVARSSVARSSVARSSVARSPVARAPAPAATIPVPLPLPAPVPTVANKKKTKDGGGTIRSGSIRSGSRVETPSRLYQEGGLSSPTPKLANTFSDFVEAIFADTPKTAAPNKQNNSFDGSFVSSWGMIEDGPPRLILADTHLTDISPPEESPITKTINDRNMRVVGVSQQESLLDQRPGVSSKLAKEKKMAPKPAQKRNFFQRRTRNTAPVQSKPKLNYPTKNGQKETISKLHNKATLKPAQDEQDSRWRRTGQASQQKEMPPPPMKAALEKKSTIKPRRYPSRLTEASSAAAVGSSLGLGTPLPTFWSATAATTGADEAQQSQASSVGSASTRGTWNEIVDASRIVGKAFRSVELSPSDYAEDNPEDRLDNLMSIVSEDSSLGDVERALEVLKKHANRLGIRESDLLQSLKSDEDALLRNLRSKSDMKSEIKFVKSEEDDSLYISGVASGVLSGDDGDDEEASIRSLTLAEELLYAFQVYTTGVPTKK